MTKVTSAVAALALAGVSAAAAPAIEETKVRGVPTRDFSDAGAERNFTKDVEAEFTSGEFANFFAAGLVTPPAA